MQTVPLLSVSANHSEEPTKYEAAHDNLLKTKKSPRKKNTVPVESALKSQTPISLVTPTKVSKFGDYTYWKKDYSNRLHRSQSK